jgi:hypothetical protein
VDLLVNPDSSGSDEVTLLNNSAAAFASSGGGGPQIVHIHQDSGAVRGGAGNINPDGAASIEARMKGITRCSIQFSEDVRVRAEDIEIRNGDDTQAEVEPSTFTYDSDTRTLTMTWLDGTFVNRWIRIRIRDSVTSAVTGAALDGEVFLTAGNPTSGAALDGGLPSGDGVPGGSAVFVLGSLVGDVNGDRQVRANDQAVVRNNLNSTEDIPSDVNGDGQVRANDQALVRNNLNQALPPVPAP